MGGVGWGGQAREGGKGGKGVAGMCGGAAGEYGGGCVGFRGGVVCVGGKAGL